MVIFYPLYATFEPDLRAAWLAFTFAFQVFNHDAGDVTGLPAAGCLFIILCTPAINFSK